MDMRKRRLFGVIAALGAMALGSACGGKATSSQGLPYLDDASYRRSELVASLVNPDDQYAQLRLGHYATGDTNDWDHLEEWNPPVDVIAASELDAPGGASTFVMSPQAAPLVLPASVTSEDDPALVALGEQAFHRYPVQVDPYFRLALTSRAAAAKYGLWVDDAAGAGGLVRAQMANGSGAVAVTCSTCHMAPGRRRAHAGRAERAPRLGRRHRRRGRRPDEWRLRVGRRRMGPGAARRDDDRRNRAGAHRGPAAGAMALVPAGRRDRRAARSNRPRHPPRDAHHHVAQRGRAPAADGHPRPGRVRRLARRRAPLESTLPRKSRRRVRRSSPRTAPGATRLPR